MISVFQSFHITIIIFVFLGQVAGIVNDGLEVAEAFNGVAYFIEE